MKEIFRLFLEPFIFVSEYQLYVLMYVSSYLEQVHGVTEETTFRVSSCVCTYVAQVWRRFASISLMEYLLRVHSSTTRLRYAKTVCLEIILIKVTQRRLLFFVELRKM